MSALDTRPGPVRKWDSQHSHQASLALPAVQAAIAKARPLIAGFGERFETRPVAGPGLPAPGLPD